MRWSFSSLLLTSIAAAFLDVEIPNTLSHRNLDHIISTRTTSGFSSSTASTQAGEPRLQRRGGKGRNGSSKGNPSNAAKSQNAGSPAHSRPQKGPLDRGAGPSGLSRAASQGSVRDVPVRSNPALNSFMKLAGASGGSSSGAPSSSASFKTLSKSPSTAFYTASERSQSSVGSSRSGKLGTPVSSQQATTKQKEQQNLAKPKTSVANSVGRNRGSPNISGLATQKKNKLEKQKSLDSGWVEVRKNQNRKVPGWEAPEVEKAAQVSPTGSNPNDFRRPAPQPRPTEPNRSRLAVEGSRPPSASASGSGSQSAPLNLRPMSASVGQGSSPRLMPQRPEPPQPASSTSSSKSQREDSQSRTQQPPVAQQQQLQRVPPPRPLKVPSPTESSGNRVASSASSQTGATLGRSDTRDSATSQPAVPKQQPKFIGKFPAPSDRYVAPHRRVASDGIDYSTFFPTPYEVHTQTSPRQNTQTQPSQSQQASQIQQPSQSQQPLQNQQPSQTQPQQDQPKRYLPPHNRASQGQSPIVPSPGSSRTGPTHEDPIVPGPSPNRAKRVGAVGSPKNYATSGAGTTQ